LMRDFATCLQTHIVAAPEVPSGAEVAAGEAAPEAVAAAAEPSPGAAAEPPPGGDAAEPSPGTPPESVGSAADPPSAPAAAEATAHEPGARVALALQPPQRRLDEHAEADDARERVPRQAEHERASAAPEPQRLAGLDPHAPQHLLDAARLEGGLHVVVRADRHA